MLTTIDYIAIVLYATTLIAVGYYYSRRESADGFLISERRLSLFGAISTINATKTGSIVLLYVALLYQFGLSAMWYFIGMWTGYVVFIPFARKLHRTSHARYYTLGDYFAEHFGATAGHAASLINIVTMVGFLVLNLIAATKVLSFYSGMSPTISAVIVALVVMTYLLMAGFKAVVKTDILQYLAILFILIAFLVPLSGGTSIPASEWDWFKADTASVVGFFLVGVLIPFASPDLWQRVYAIPSEKRVAQSIFYSILFHAAVGIVLTFVGLLIKAELPHLDPDIALVEGFSQLLPAGMSGLALIVFFSAFMSSIDTYAYTASSSIVQGFQRKQSKEDAVATIRRVLIGVLILGTIISITLNDLGKAAFIFVGYIIVLAIPTIATWIKPSIRPTTVSMGIVLGAIFLTLFLVIDLLTGNLQPILAIKGVAGSIVGLLIGAIVSRFAQQNT